MSVTPGLFESTDPAVAAWQRGNWELDFWVPGRPQTGGSKRGFAHPHTGRVIVTEDFKGKSGQAKRAWRSDLRDAAQVRVFDGDGVLWDAGSWPADGPLEVEFVFVLARPKAQYRTGRYEGLLRDGAPGWPSTLPDALKLARAAEDALTGVVWADDARIVRETLEKQYPDRVGLARGAEGCFVRVRRIG